MNPQERPLRFLAWPDWTEEQAMTRLVALASPLANRAGAQLVLIRDPLNDPSETTAFECLQRAFDLRFPPQAQLDVLVSDHGRPPSELANSCDALLVLGTEAPELITAIGLPQLDSPIQVLEMLKREGKDLLAGPEPVASNLTDRTDSAPVISVIVPGFGRPEHLKQLMGALDVQDLSKEKFELIICDDGSEPPLVSGLELSAHAYTVVVLQQENRGPAAARNTAIRAARGPLLIFLDDDSIPSENCLSGHLAAQLQASGNVAVLGGFGLKKEHHIDSLALLAEQTTMIYPHSALRGGMRYQADCIRTTNLSIPTLLIEGIGGFDETFKVPSAEDSEIGLRLKSAHNTTVFYDPKISCIHDHAPTIDDFANRQQALGWSTAYMAWRHDDFTMIVGTASSRPGEQFWIDLESGLQDSLNKMEELMTEIRQQLDTEHQSSAPEVLAPEFIQKVKKIGFAFFSRGLIDGHREIEAMLKARDSTSS